MLKTIDMKYLQDDQAEKSILSMFMADNQEFFAHETDESLFFSSNRILIYQAMRTLIQSGCEADIVSLFVELKGKGVKASELSELSSYPISTNTAYHISCLQKARTRRQMYQAYSHASQMCIDGCDPSEIASNAKLGITNIETFEPVSSRDLALSVVESVNQEMTTGSGEGLKSGLRRLDTITNGFLPGEFVIIAGRPGVGKTSLALNILRNYGFMGYPGSVFSLEMKKDQLFRRMICDVGSVDMKFLFHGLLNKNDSVNVSIVNDAAQMIGEFPIEWDDTPRLTIDQIYSRAKKAKTLRDIKWIMVDHIGRINGWNTPGQEKKSDITGMFASMAVELDIVVIVLSQLNREIEKRSTRTPQMSDLRDAGSLEQDCDIAIFPDVPPKEGSGTMGDESDEATLYIVKTRRGRKGKITGMKWQGHYYRYSDEKY
jgi:replicative DNA helicase